MVRDAVVTMGLSSKPDARPDHPIRIIVIEAEPHAKRGGRRGKTAGPGNKGTVVIATKGVARAGGDHRVDLSAPLGDRDLTDKSVPLCFGFGIVSGAT